MQRRRVGAAIAFIAVAWNVLFGILLANPTRFSGRFYPPLDHTPDLIGSAIVVAFIGAWPAPAIPFALASPLLLAVAGAAALVPPWQSLVDPLVAILYFVAAGLRVESPERRGEVPLDYDWTTPVLSLAMLLPALIYDPLLSWTQSLCLGRDGNWHWTSLDASPGGPCVRWLYRPSFTLVIGAGLLIYMIGIAVIAHLRHARPSLAQSPEPPAASRRIE